MGSVVGIVNSALSKIGVEPIASLSEESKAGRLANRTFYVILDALLYDHYWNFAIKRQALALDPTPAIGGGSKFVLPADMERPIRLLNNYPYKIESGFLITSNVSEANLLYVWRNHNPATFTSKFSEALAYRLAAEWAYPLVQSVSLGESMEKKAKSFTLDAAATDAQEDYLDTAHSNQFLDAHFAESDYPSTYERY